MKLYISADIEGVACISAAAETDPSQPSDYLPFRDQMTAETAAACAGAYEGGVESILVKDAHGPARNLDPHRLSAPEGKSLELIRGWSMHPFKMVQGIDKTFGMAAFVGFHSAAGSGGNPLSHTVSGKMFTKVELNGEAASEFHLFALAASSVGVPVGFLSGDQTLCEEAERRIDGIVTVATLQGVGASVRSIVPQEAVRRIREGVRHAVTATPPTALTVPKDFAFRLSFAKPSDAHFKGFFPGVRQVSDTDVLLETPRLMDVLTFLMFAARP